MASVTMRGVRAGGTSTITSSLLGGLRDDPRSRAEFLTLTTGAASPMADGRVADGRYG
jgi:GTP cyclohydrolase I